MVRKSSRGRQKIQMTRMSKESNLLVTFSKRRSGLFKKASELCTLCGAEIAIIVFSPGKKVFSFGHPGVESIVDRYLETPPPTSAAAPPRTTPALQLVEAHRSASLRELNAQLNDMLRLLEAEKARGENLSRLRKEDRGGGRWWEAPIEKQGVGELEQLKEAMEGLRKNVCLQAEKMMILPPPPPPPPFLVVEPKAEDRGFDVLAGKDPSAGVGQLSVTPHGFTLGFGPSFF